jgi:hypothetical protein
MRRDYLSAGLALVAAGLLLAALLSATARPPRAVLPATAVPAHLDVAARSVIPIGTATALGNGWILTVLEVIPDAAAEMLVASILNPPPAPGTQFFMVRVSAAFDDATPCLCDAFRAPSPFTLRALGPRGQVYASFRQETSCGLATPDGLPPVLGYRGAYASPTITGNVCWQVPTVDADQLLLVYEPLDGAEARTPARYFATYSSS